MKLKLLLVSCGLVVSGWAWTHRTTAQETHTAMHSPTKAAKVVTVKGKEATVNMKDLVFSAQVLKVKVGTKVTWVNQEAVPHTVDSATDAFSSGNLTQGQSFSYTFDKVGTYRYYCAYHGGKDGSGMAGTVKVTKK